MGIFNQKDNQEIERLKEENEELRNTLHNVLSKHKNFEELEKKIEAEKMKLSEMAKEEQRIEDFLENTSSDKVSKSNLIFELTKQIGDLTKSKEQLGFEAKTLEETLKKLDDKRREYEVNIKLLLVDLEKREAEVELFDNNINELTQANTKLNEELSLQEGKVESLRNTSNDLLEQIETFEQRLLTTDERITEKESIQKKIEVEVELLTNNLEELKDETDALSHKVEEQKKIEEEKRTTINTLEERLAYDEEIRANLQKGLADMTKQLNEKDKLFNDYSTKKDNVLQEIQIKLNELENIKNEITNNTKENKIVLEETELLKQKKKDLIKELENFKTVKVEIERDLFSKQENLTELDEKINDNKKKISELENKRYRIEENNILLESSLTETTLKFTEEINAAKTKLSSIKRIIVEKERNLNNKEKLFNEMNTQVYEYTGMVQLLKKEKGNYEQKIAELKKEKTELMEEMPSFKEKENKHKLRIGQLKSELEVFEVKKKNIERDFGEFLESRSKNFNESQKNSEILSNEITRKESILEKLDTGLDDLKASSRILKDEIAKAELEKEEHSTNIAQLIAMEKTFQLKVESYKKELERIEEETLLDLPHASMDLSADKKDDETVTEQRETSADKINDN